MTLRLSLTALAALTLAAPAVSDPGDPVMLSNPGWLVDSEGQALSLQLEASDSLGLPLTYSATDLPDGLTLDPSTGQLTGSPDAAVSAFTLMKVIGRDVWIGVWAFVLSLIATTRWENTGISNRPQVGEIWRRFPKFVLGFLIASALVTLISQGYDYATYKKEVIPALVAPLQSFRTWAFTFAFLSIGLTTRLREFARFGARPFYAFAIGVAVNVVIGFVLSTQVFSGFWNRLN